MNMSHRVACLQPTQRCAIKAFLVNPACSQQSRTKAEGIETASTEPIDIALIASERVDMLKKIREIRWPTEFERGHYNISSPVGKSKMCADRNEVVIPRVLERGRLRRASFLPADRYRTSGGGQIQMVVAACWAEDARGVPRVDPLVSLLILTSFEPH